MTNTILQYLDDTYIDTGEAKLLRTGQDDRGSYVVLDQTVFYPQGGGQPADMGSISTGTVDMAVSFVGFDNGEVLHYLAEAPSEPDALVRQSCALRVDKARRLHHARLHTAGHVISSLVDARRGPLRAVKGFHFPDGPYVEFEGKLEEASDAFLAGLQAEIDALLAEAPPVTAATVTYDELKARCWSVPSYLPQDKPLRVVTIGALDPVPCGGTHLASLAEIDTITVLKIKSKKGNTKISYQVGGEA